MSPAPPQSHLDIDGLLTKGYFPKELPPPFTTATLGALLNSQLSGLPTDFDPAQKPSKPLQSAQLSRHSLLRAAGLRRILGIPNPVSFCRLSRFVVDNWLTLAANAQQSTLSLSKPTPGAMERAIGSQYSLGEKPARRALLRSCARYIVQTDISSFYPSIYTHSIPWAIHTKPASKANRTCSPQMYGNCFDMHMRNLQDGQTGGIPIGPDTSLLVAEIILGAVDTELLKKLPNLKGFRFIDDYELGFDTRGEAESALATLESSLADFELALNPMKTRILELPVAFEEQWTSEIRTFPFRDKGAKGQYHDLVAYFDLAFRHLKSRPSEGVLKYAIPRLNSETIKDENWDLFQRILSQCCRVEPATIPSVIEQLTFYTGQGLALDGNLWQTTLNAVVVERLPLGHTSECAWAIWGLICFGLTVSALACNEVQCSDDMIVGMLGLDAREKALTGQHNLGDLDRLVEPDELYGRSWLLCYEATRRGWLTAKSGANAVTSDTNFAYLEQNQVTFYDETAQAPSPRRNSMPSPAGSSDSGV